MILICEKCGITEMLWGVPASTENLEKNKLCTDCQGKTSPQDGGCWYCWKLGVLMFSVEWDTNVHAACIQKALEEDPNDPEAGIFKREAEEAGDKLEDLVKTQRKMEEAR